MGAVDPLVQRRLDRGLTAASPDPPARQTSRDDLAVVDDQAVTGAQLIRQVADGTVVELRSLTGPHHQELCGVPRIPARRRAMRSAGRSKSKRSVRMAFLRHARHSGPAEGRPEDKPCAGRDIGGRKHAVLQTAMPGYDGVATGPAGANDYAPIVALTILVGIPDGLSALDLVDVFHAFDHHAGPNRCTRSCPRKLASSKQMKN